MRSVMTTMAQQELPEARNTLRTVAKNNRIHIDKPEVAGKWACAGVYVDPPRAVTWRSATPPPDD